jgi:hypothetical protein
MLTKFIEAGNGWNWGKFVVAQFDPEEWHRRPKFPGCDGEDAAPLIVGRGWDPRRHYFVMDLQTGEGAMFALDGSPDYDLTEKHAIWTCPMFKPFLRWLYAHYADGWRDPAELPDFVTFTEEEAPSSMAGSRGRGPWSHA